MYLSPQKTYSNLDSPWPVWISGVTNVSHLLLALACSTNFFVYYAKHGQKRSAAAQGPKQPLSIQA